MTEFLQLDLAPLLAATLACLVCGLIGNLLLLTRQSLMGDAISHSVLPGIVAGFWVTGTRATLPLVLGALVAAIIASLLIGLLRRLTRLEPGAAMGVVFSGMFALGLVLIEVSGAHAVDLDVDCVLYGQLEALIWPAATGAASLLDPAALAEFPTEVLTLLGALALVLLVLLVMWKELRLAAFDPDFAQAIGFSPRLLSGAVLVMVSVACVASFWAVGSVLVIAALVAPPAIARLMTNDYATQFALSALVAVAMGAGGYLAAAAVPGALGLGHGLSAAGMMAVVAGLLLALAWAFAPFGRRGGRGGAVPVG
ncbi:metal ABC transporter permease [Roseomonas marmotae]|uniref:Metal ABC transporter permease n=1 Tax=Roseomonas marmotae TaxID=2768161 RepID=A0ABS3KDI0_9PROT|nr:metal ABC transporter permease [Roseomonas marmotae]MBO1074990.1 metal ABC transporter permease [Roseomonas marmotae]QTI79973.1 metal ABC transporter permease [Roseomonas marmotae]